mmetsp:Transcript_3852/g.8196  ORF Transcript_3852/g.8196 Transcript_3852/m.8196 type:complete len:611 (-) Transcript_3852:141-1973(-)
MQNQGEANSFPYNLSIDYRNQNPSNDNNGQDQQPNQLNDFMGTFFQINHNNNGNGQAWRTCRFCQQNAFVTSEGLADHEASCHIQVNQQQIQQLLAQQQFQQQQQQNFADQQQLLGNPSTAFQLSQLFPNANPFAGIPQEGCGNNLNVANMAAVFQNQALSQQVKVEPGLNNNHFCHDVGTDNNFQGLFDNGNDTIPETKSKNNPQNSSSLNKIGALRRSDGASSGEFFPLAMPEDDDWLTPLHCFVRRYCVEVFVATPDDVAAPCMGKRNPVSVSQVGIRCPFCSPERVGTNETDIARARENGVVYPSLISRIYNATINLLQRHLRTCAFVPPEILARYEELKSSNARSGASKKYWAESALRLGLVDTPDGIRFVKPSDKDHTPTMVTQKGDSSAPPLVLPSDKRYTTAFTFHLMAQMQPCVFTEADRLGRRRGLDVGFAGLACRHCFGAYGTGRFFPSSVKTMSDASKTLDVIYKHVMKCKTCPADIKVGLRNLREFHDSERSKMPFGNQRAFFTKIWGRLHEHDGDEFASPAAAAPSMQALHQQQMQQWPGLPFNADQDGDDDDKKPAAVSLTAAKSQDNNLDSLHALYAHFNSLPSKPTKMMNEAA